MSSRPPFRRTDEDISNVEMQSRQPSSYNDILRQRLASEPVVEGKDAGAGFNVTDSIGSGNSTKIERVQYGEVEPIQDFTTDSGPPTKNKYEGDPFGNEDGNKVKYKTLTWWYVTLQLSFCTRRMISNMRNRQTGFIMIAETISLGILSLPSVLAAVGLIA